MQRSDLRSYARFFACPRVGSVLAGRLLGLLLLLLPVIGSPALAAPSATTPASSVTLLTPTGILNRDLSAREVAGWNRELRRESLSNARAARLHLWLGEVEIARNQEPERALQQFALAQRLARCSDPVYGCAAFDRAFTLYRSGAFSLAVSAFRNLLQARPHPTGFSVTDAILLSRHAAACEGYHAQHAKLGITEPSRLDPLCGVASLAACLQAHGKPSDKKTLLSHCRLTGLGNSLQDLIDCAQRLGMSARCVRTDEEGLRVLPKPLVAYVEGDHFIAVTRADQDGVSYLCSDCGVWPGGRRDLSWKQWKAMDCSICLVVTEPRSAVDDALHALQTGSNPEQAVAGTRPARLASLKSGVSSRSRALAVRLLGAHTLLYVGSVVVCNTVVAGTH